MIFPGQLHKVSAVAEEGIPQTLIEIDGSADVPHHDLGHELFGRMHISAHIHHLENEVVPASATNLLTLSRFVARVAGRSSRRLQAALV